MVLLICFVVILFGFVVLFGAPYVPTIKKRAIDALDLLDLRPGQTMLELGSGDGVVAREAASRGIRVVGYELNPLLVVVSKIRCRKHKDLVTIIWGNYWRLSWPDSDGMYVFLLDKYMHKLDLKIQSYCSGRDYRLVSNTFEIPHRKLVKRKNGMLLYLYK